MSLGKLASRVAPHTYGRYIDFSLQRQRTRIARLLADCTPPVLLDAQGFYDLMSRRFPRAATYEYDRFSATARAGTRVQRLASLVPALLEPREVLEVSCGDGLVGAVLAIGGHEVTLADVRDWRSDGARHLPFVEWDVGTAPTLEERRFDLVIAYNAAEHWADPQAALQHLLALCKPGGRVVLDFGPLFNSPWGLHAWSLGFPYPQFLFNRSFIDAQIARIGVGDLGNVDVAVQPTNGWAIAEFRALWRRCGAVTLSNLEDHDHRYLNFIEEFGPCFQGRGLGLEDLTINSIEVVLEKRRESAS